jgi:pilus assembly protein CpaB
MGRRTLLLIASILIAAVGTALIGLYVRGADDRAQQTEGTFPTLVATKEIPPNTSIEAAVSSMELKPVPGRMAEGGYQGSGASAAILGEQKGKVTTETIYPEQTVLKSMFGAAGVVSGNGITKERAVSVELTDPARVAGVLAPGSNVTIYLLPDPDDNDDLKQPYVITKNGTVVLTPSIKMPIVLQNARVLGIGNQRLGASSTATNADGTATETDNVPRTIVTLDLSAEEATKVVSAQNYGELYFAVNKGSS